MALGYDSVSVEFGILCAAVRDDRNHLLTALTKSGLDWQHLLSLATAHGVRPQLARVFRKLNWSRIPRSIQCSLNTFLGLHNARTLLLAKELTLLDEELSKNKVRFATFKGPSLALSLYGDLCFRECNDIDLIVKQTDIAQTESILA